MIDTAQRPRPATLRPANHDDIPTMARIVHDWECATGYIADTPDVETLEGFIADAFEMREMTVVGDPVFGYLSIDPADNKLGALYLRHTGQGNGKRLMDHAKQGRNQLWLTVYVTNTRAQNFYRREGFLETRHLAADRPGAPDMLRMEWQA
ncbi:N-acetyltransferase family protein [Sagittula sp. SSi028]|uniref:GNAT family N-acetyltransferase n=1 Tax=Sagittula sp. SSi028 TaxID=3400636 RepID=UPI003AF8E5A4